MNTDERLLRIELLLCEVLRVQRIILSKESRTMSAITDLQSAVEAETTVNQSAITLLQNLSSQIAAASNDPAVQALAAQVQANAAALAAAVTANTPAAPPAPPPATP